jgi:hypothetical protein
MHRLSHSPPGPLAFRAPAPRASNTRYCRLLRQALEAFDRPWPARIVIGMLAPPCPEERQAATQAMLSLYRAGELALCQRRGEVCLWRTYGSSSARKAA